MRTRLDELETERLVQQLIIDGKMGQLERNVLGQFATPTSLATEIIKCTGDYLGSRKEISFLEPACGTGSFIYAVKKEFGDLITNYHGIEINQAIGKVASKLWGDKKTSIEIGDFTTIKPSKKFDLLVSNPPYVRHQHLEKEQKNRLGVQVEQITGIRLSGLADLYAYFLLLSHRWLAPDALSVWLIPSGFMDVNYGAGLKRYLLEQVDLLHIHCFNHQESQFDDALVSSSVIWFKNRQPQQKSSIKMTFGKALNSPDVTISLERNTLNKDMKWSRIPFTNSSTRYVPDTKLSDLFVVKRGIATGANKYFILDESRITELNLPHAYLKPVLPGSRYISENEILADFEGNPQLEKRIFLLDCNLQEEEIKEHFPALYDYLQSGHKMGIPSRYLCSHRELWYCQENRPPAPIICTYMGRKSKNKNPFRFIRNRTNATATNNYLMLYPTGYLKNRLEQNPGLIDKIWQRLNELAQIDISNEGRTYGGGLHKIEPRELGNVQITKIAI